jgi:hypothetical protein
MRHLIFAEGIRQTINRFSNRYAHSVPTPLDPYVFSFDTLEDYDKVAIKF